MSANSKGTEVWGRLPAWVQVLVLMPGAHPSVGVSMTVCTVLTCASCSQRPWRECSSGRAHNDSKG